MRRFAPGVSTHLSRLNHVAPPDHAHTSIFRIVFGEPASRRRWRWILPATGGWRTVSPISGSQQCNGSMWGAVVWEKTPGGRDTHNPDVSKQNRPTLGMPILIDMKKKPGVDQWEGQVYNAKDGQYLQLDDQAGRSRPTRNSRLRAGLSLRRRNLDPRRRSDPVRAPPTAWRTAHRKPPVRYQSPLHRRPPRRPRLRCAQDYRVRERRRQGTKAGDFRTAGRSSGRYLSTSRHRGVYPLAPAGTAAPRPTW